jgi:hypothetical protein
MSAVNNLIQLLKLIKHAERPPSGHASLDKGATVHSHAAPDSRACAAAQYVEPRIHHAGWDDNWRTGIVIRLSKIGCHRVGMLQPYLLVCRKY